MDGHTEVRLEVEPRGKCRLKLRTGDTDREIAGKYEVDFTKDPIPFTIREIGALEHPLHTALRFVGRDEIHLARFAGRWRLRPLDINPDEAIVLSRAEP